MQVGVRKSQAFNFLGRFGSLLFSVPLLVMVTGTFSPALAHYPWLTVLDHDPITFEIGWGHDFPTDGTLPMERLGEVTLIMPKGEKRPLNLQAAEQHQAGAAAGGVHLLLAEQRPGYYSRTPEGGRAGNREEFPAAVSCSRSHNNMKAVISNGPGGDPARIVGHPLEIVPLVDPGTLTAGDSLPLQLLLDGQPYNGELAATWAGYEGEDEFAATITADARGRAELPLSANGHWLVMSEARQDYPEPRRCDQLVYRSIVTFHTR